MTLNVPRYNGWVPSRAVYDAFINDLMERATTPYSAGAEHVPSVKRFQEAIQANPTMVNLFNNVFLQAPQSQSQVRDFEHLLQLFDLIVVGPPRFMVVSEHGVTEPIGVPMYLVFDLLSNSSAAYDLFRMEAFNEALKRLLSSWGDYLRTSDSGSTLTDAPDGWFSQGAIQALEEGRGKFNQTYVVLNDTAINRGYTSWDQFFTRQIRSDARPIVPAPKDKTVVYNACESTVERYKFNVQAHDKFWLKGTMSYSLYDIFNGDNETAQHFVGGTVYQAFLSPQDYHRWHSPVTGKVVAARIVDGTYYAVLPDEGEGGDPRGALIRSQPWLTVAATRAIITIQADSEKIGLVAFIGVGMAEVSTCQLLVQPGSRVEPGQEIGMFHFGGSSHALIFGPHVKVTFTDEVEVGKHIHVNRIIASVDQ
ncbi:unnamed protein product [Rhizoctonia solani]|uniref:L-tryptophan decarboxylase PsiD-like domain-containing protein n=1 Tax=Rhizoctonia solani TaxID=456999 RepID=A0A8H3BBI1_9AGAM|nr:unnamed protein product [Rhizoctonia solani]